MDNCKLPVLPPDMFWRIQPLGDNTCLCLMKRTPRRILVGYKYERVGGSWIHLVKNDYSALSLDEIKKQIEEKAVTTWSDYNTRLARKAGLASLNGDYPPKKLT